MKQVPPVAFLESALESLKENDPDRIAALKELKALGRARMQALRERYLRMTNFQRGYLLGLETARLMTEALAALPPEPKA